MDHIWWNFSCEGQNGGNNGGTMMYNYGLDHRELCGKFLVLIELCKDPWEEIFEVRIYSHIAKTLIEINIL